MNGVMTRRTFQARLAAVVGAASLVMATSGTSRALAASEGRGTRRVFFRFQRKANVLLAWFRITDRTDPGVSIPFTFQLSSDRKMTSILQTRALTSTVASSHIVRGMFVVPKEYSSGRQPLFARILVGEESFPTQVIRIGAKGGSTASAVSA
jgi:hypothetical protein